MQLLFVTAILAFAIDQASKYWIVHVLNLKERLAIDVLPPLVNFRMGWNEGINFGLFSNSPEFARYILILIAIVVSAFLIW